jgi:hypothetical protein
VPDLEHLGEAACCSSPLAAEVGDDELFPLDLRL